ncbi:hypothetical protein IGW14_16405 [Streptomyces hygroscopicus subsp. hygroscopicus]|uniref:hypothetical protein n=1 Tax=Streptomyces hygroscopicus TaxID=1912 RepID=UPI001C65DAFE|nr:hypothetical protein [Streptomyces hygroscopicus]MBW8089556.1 hypothetical protein [Streptomyces hygroscopicus subsp. hygroscopicus]
MTTLDDREVRMIFDGGGHYENDRWWSDYHRRWFPVNFDPAGYAEIHAVQVGTKWGRSFALGFFMQSGVVKRYQFQLKARTSSATWVDAATEFLVLYRGGPEIVPEEKDTIEALDRLHSKATSLGWIPLPQTGIHWYSYAYSHPTVEYD